MKSASARAFVLSTLLTLVLLAPAGLSSGLRAAATPGTFLGELVAGPHGDHAAGVLYLLGRDGNVRRVLLGRASVVYDREPAAGAKHPPATHALVPGAEVRVTAMVDARSGEWTASHVEVLTHPVESAEDQEGNGDEALSDRQLLLAQRTI